MKTSYRSIFQTESGLTLIELLGTTLIVILLTLLAAQVYEDVFDRVRMAKSERDQQAIEAALERFRTDNFHYPSRLMELVHQGYLRPHSFETPWRKKHYYFYAVDNNSTGKSLAYALGDPGPFATCQAGKVILYADSDEPIPCGRDPNLPAWSYQIMPTLTLHGGTVELFRGHATLRTFRTACWAIRSSGKHCDLRTES